MEAYARKYDLYKTLQETENGLWAESAEYIADRYYEENQSSHEKKAIGDSAVWKDGKM